MTITREAAERIIQHIFQHSPKSRSVEHCQACLIGMVGSAALTPELGMAISEEYGLGLSWE